MTAPGKAAHLSSAGQASPLELGSLRRVWVAVRGSRTAAWVGDTEAQVKQRAHHSSSYSYEEWWERLEETESGLRFWNVSDALQHELAESSARWLL